MIAVDWGTSSLRAYLLDSDGTIVEKRAAALGIMQVADGAFSQALMSQIGPWLSRGESQVLMSGMIGARQGWVEAPYCECPAGFAQIARGLKAVTWDRHTAWIAPGVSGFDAAGVRDVMRGEELQILGAMESIPSQSGLICLPGTHSKWVRVEGGLITGFSTHMTGEVFSLLRQHSLLGRMMREGPTEESAFREGLSRATQSEGLLHHLFGVRAKGLFGELADTHAASYLSGLLIGHEMRAALAASPARELLLLGSPELTHLYTLAAEHAGLSARTLDAEAVVRGLYLLSKEIS